MRRSTPLTGVTTSSPRPSRLRVRRERAGRSSRRCGTGSGRGHAQEPPLRVRPRASRRRRLSAATRWCSHRSLRWCPAEPQPPVAAGDQPGDRPFDHGPVLAVDGLELGVLGAGSVRALQRVVRMQGQLAAAGGAGAAGPQRAVAAARAEGRLAGAGDPGGQPVRAGHRGGGLVDGEVVEGEPAVHGRAQRPRLDDRGVPGLRAARPAARRCRRPNRPAPRAGRVRRPAARSDRGVGVLRPGGRGQRARR